MCSDWEITNAPNRLHFLATLSHLSDFCLLDIL